MDEQQKKQMHAMLVILAIFLLMLVYVMYQHNIFSAVGAHNVPDYRPDLVERGVIPSGLKGPIDLPGESDYDREVRLKKEYLSVLDKQNQDLNKLYELKKRQLEILEQEVS